MNNNQEKLKEAFEFAMANRPKIGGFPFLAECLRQAGVIKCQVDFLHRTVKYFGSKGEKYEESYPAMIDLNS